MDGTHTALVVGAIVWFTVQVMLRLALITYSLAAALLLAALIAPLATRLCRFGVPSALAALASIIVLLGIPTGVGLLLYRRASQRMGNLGATVTAGIDDVRNWLINGPLSLEPVQVGSLRNTIVGRLEQMMPSVLAGTTTALHLLGAVALVIFAVFFLIKDGPSMWRWAPELGATRTPLTHGRRRTAGMVDADQLRPGHRSHRTGRRHLHRRGTVLSRRPPLIVLGPAHLPRRLRAPAGSNRGRRCRSPGNSGHQWRHRRGDRAYRRPRRAADRRQPAPWS